jgi:hypothetical protein
MYSQEPKNWPQLPKASYSFFPNLRIWHSWRHLHGSQRAEVRRRGFSQCYMRVYLDLCEGLVSMWMGLKERKSGVEGLVSMWMGLKERKSGVEGLVSMSDRRCVRRARS